MFLLWCKHCYINFIIQVNVDDTTESSGSEFEDDGNCEPSKKNIQEESTASELNDTELEDGDIDPDWMSIGEETEGSATADDEDIDNDKNESTVSRTVRYWIYINIHLVYSIHYNTCIQFVICYIIHVQYMHMYSILFVFELQLV